MAAERTIPLNPLDSTAVAYVGLMLSDAGDWERGVSMVMGAMDRNPHHPGWHHYALFTDHYRKADYEESLTHAKRSNMPQFVWTPLMMAVAAGQLGNAADARAAFDGLQKNHPAYLDPEKVRTLWSFWHWDEELVDRFMDGFAKAQALAQSGSATASRKRS